MKKFNFKITNNEGSARLGTILTKRDDISTPAFMPVWTAVTVKAMMLERVDDTAAAVF